MSILATALVSEFFLTLELFGFEFEGNGIAVIELFCVDNGGSIDQDGFKVENGLDVVEAMNVHEAEEREVGDVVRNGEVWIKSNTKIAERGIGGEGKRHTS